MSNINILNKQGFLTSEERKRPLVHGCDYFTFNTCLDLSQPIQVIPYTNYKEVSIEMYSKDVASFICWWTNFIHKDLNGFSGFSNVKFELVGFKIKEPITIEEGERFKEKLKEYGNKVTETKESAQEFLKEIGITINPKFQEGTSTAASGDIEAMSVTALFKRKGVIKISHTELIKEDRKLLEVIFTNFHPTGILSCPDSSNVITYIGGSKLFDEAKEGQPIPEYIIQVRANKDRSTGFTGFMKM